MKKAEEFIFPIKRDQLFEKPSDDRFWIDEKFLYQNSVNSNQTILNDILKTPLIITTKPIFVFFFSLFRDKSPQSIEEKNQYSQKLLEGFFSFISDMERDIDIIKQNKDISFQYRNGLKIYSFFITWIIEQYSYSQSDKEKIIKTPMKKHKSKKTHHYSFSNKKAKDKDINEPRSKSKNKKKTQRKTSMNSEGNNSNNISNQINIDISFFLKSLIKLIELRIEVIFINKIIENEFLSCIINSMFLLLKIKSSQLHPSLIQKEKNKIFLILNTIISKYQSYTNIYIILQNLNTSIIELIYTNESLITNLSEFLYIGIANDAKLHSFTNEIIGELIIIINKDSKYESQGMKNIGTFLISLELKLPKLIYNLMPILIKLYNSKSYFIRNAISEIIGGIIIDCLCKNVDSIDSADLRNEYYKAKQKFIDLLFKRLYDENCFSRNKVLQVFERLCDSNSLGIDDYLELMKETTIRIKDERAQVRKRAIELLEKIIMVFATVFKCNNHFAEITQVDEEIRICSLKIEEIKHSIHKDDNKDDDMLIVVNDDNHKEKNEDINKIQDKNSDEELFNQLNQEESLIEYYSKYKAVITSINSTIPYIIDLLYSKSISDVIQSISLLKTLNQLNISEAFNGIKKMLSLILSTENTIQRKLMEAIVAIYFNSTIPIITQLNSVMLLMKNLNRSELSCFALMIKSMIEEHFISLKIVKELYIRMVNTNDSIEDKNCLLFLTKAAESEKRVIVENADVYLKIVEQRILKDKIEWEWLKESISGLIIIYRNLKDKEKNVVNVINKIIRVMIIKGVINEKIEKEKYEDEWYSAAQEIINVIFEIYPNPDIITNNLMSILIKKLNENQQVSQIKVIDTHMEDIMITEEDINNHDNNNNNKSSFPKNQLIEVTKLIFLIGHISLNIINYIDQIQSNILQDKNSTNNHPKEEKHEEEKQYEAKREYTIDLIQRLFDTQYITSSNFKPYLNLINSITSRLLLCPHHELESNGLLYKSVLLTQCKLMCINSTYCNDTLPFLIQILTSDIIPPMLKLNLYVSLGDLINRFPNILHQYLPNIFNCLKENNSIIRRYIVTVISHLVLNDMLKLKGEIVDICLLLETDDQRLKDNIIFFLSKISHKGNNIIYNILPKALVKLNDVYKELPYDVIKHIIKMLVKYIDQDKQIENLLEKMFVKLKTSVNQVEWRNVSFCLSLLNYTERHAIKFLELYSIIREKIKYDETIEENFSNVLNKIKKGKNKDEVELLEKKMVLGKKIIVEKKKRKKRESKVKIKDETKDKAKAKAKAKGKSQRKKRKKCYEESDEEYNSNQKSIELEDDIEESKEKSEDSEMNADIDY